MLGGLRSLRSLRPPCPLVGSARSDLHVHSAGRAPLASLAPPFASAGRAPLASLALPSMSHLLGGLCSLRSLCPPRPLGGLRSLRPPRHVRWAGSARSDVEGGAGCKKQFRKQCSIDQPCWVGSARFAHSALHAYARWWAPLAPPSTSTLLGGLRSPHPLRFLRRCVSFEPTGQPEPKRRPPGFFRAPPSFSAAWAYRRECAAV